MSFRHFVLGLLVRGPMSGYDIRLSLKSLSWLIGRPSFGNLYRVLHNLLRDGLVTVEVQQQEKRPRRKLYSISDEGRNELRAWLDQPAQPAVSLKAFLMRLVIAHVHTPAGLAVCLGRRRAQGIDQVAALEQILQQSNGSAETDRPLAVDYSLAVARAEMAWLDQALDQLSVATQEQHPLEEIRESSPVSP